jgi:hypothetical protein
MSENEGTGQSGDAPQVQPEPEAVPQAQPTPPAEEVSQEAAAPLPSRKSDEARRAQLAQAIQNEVVQGGRVESQSEFQAVLVMGKPVNHILHLILTLVTCGIWGIVWIALLIFGGENRVMVNIDEYGNVLRQKVK